MKNFLLRAKPWMIFVPIILPTVVMLVGQYFYMQWIFDMQEQSAAGENPLAGMAFDLEELRIYAIGLTFILALAYGIQLGWYHSVVTGLREYLPVGADLSPKRFRVATIVATGYCGLMLIGGYAAFEWMADVLPGFVESVQSGTDEPPFDFDEFLPVFLVIWAIAMLGGLLGFIALLFMVFYTGKTIRCIEVEKPQRGSEVAGYTILSYFLFIGIWILQPKVNRLLEKGSMTPDPVKPW